MYLYPNIKHNNYETFTTKTNYQRRDKKALKENQPPFKPDYEGQLSIPQMRLMKELYKVGNKYQMDLMTNEEIVLVLKELIDVFS